MNNDTYDLACEFLKALALNRTPEETERAARRLDVDLRMIEEERDPERWDGLE